MDFAVGDHVVYNPSIAGLAKPSIRYYDHCIITKIIDEYVIVRFRKFNPRINSVGMFTSFFSSEIGYEPMILKTSITHAPYTRKGLKHITDALIKSIPGAVQAREARRIMLLKTSISIRIQGPSQIIQEFITSNKRCFTPLPPPEL